MTRTHVALVLALGLEMQAAQGLRASGSVKGHKSWVPLEKFCFTPTTDPETVRGSLELKVEYPARSRTSVVAYLLDEENAEANNVDTWNGVRNSGKSCTERISKSTRMVLDLWKFPKSAGVTGWEQALRPQDQQVSSDISSGIVQEAFLNVLSAGTGSIRNTTSQGVNDMLSSWLGSNDRSTDGSFGSVAAKWCDGSIEKCDARGALSNVLGMTSTVMAFNKHSRPPKDHVEINGNSTVTAKHTIFFYSANIACIYVALSNCLTEFECPQPLQAECDGPVDVKYEMSFTNDGGFFKDELSAEEHGLTEIAIIFFCVQLLISIFCFIVGHLLKQLERLHHTFLILCASIGLRMCALCVELAHFVNYARTGHPPPGAIFFRTLFAESADLCLIIMGLLLAKGWTICVRKLSAQVRVKLAMYSVCYTCVIVALIVWAFYLDATTSTLSFYDSIPGYVLMGFRIFAIAWFGQSVHTTYRKYGAKKRFYKKFSVLYVLYCASMPFIIGVSQTLRADERPRLIHGWQHSFTFCVQVLVLVLYTPFADPTMSKMTSSFPFNQTTWEMHASGGKDDGTEPSVVVRSGQAAQVDDPEAARKVSLGNTGVVGRRGGMSTSAGAMDERMLRRSREFMEAAKKQLEILEDFFDDLEGKDKKAKAAEQKEEESSKDSKKKKPKAKPKTKEEEKKAKKEEDRMLGAAKVEKKEKEAKRAEEGEPPKEEGLFGALRVSSKERAEKKEKKKEKQKETAGTKSDDRVYEDTGTSKGGYGDDDDDGVGGGAAGRRPSPNPRNVRLAPLQPIGGGDSSDATAESNKAWMRRPLPPLK